MPVRKSGIRGLSHQEILFVAAYIANGFKYFKASEIAGYKTCDHYKNGWQVGKRPHVKKEIERKVNEIADRIGFTTEYTLKKLKKGVDRSIPDDDDKEFDVRSGVSCISERNRMLGVYAKVEEDKENPLDKLREDIKKIEEKADKKE